MDDTKQTGFTSRRRWAKGPARPKYLQPGDIDQLLPMLVSLMAEVSVLRDRLDTHEALAEAGAAPTGAAIENYALTPERHLRREAERQALLTRVFRAITAEVDEAAAGGLPAPADGDDA